MTTGSIQFFFRLGPENNIFSTSTLFLKKEPAIYLGPVDYGQLSELDRIRLQVKHEGSVKYPKYPNLSKISLPVRDFEALKLNAAFLLQIADDLSREAPRLGSDEDPSYNICRIFTLLFY